MTNQIISSQSGRQSSKRSIQTTMSVETKEAAMKVIQVKFLSTGLMRVIKCDGEAHWREDYDYDVRLVSDKSLGKCICGKVSVAHFNKVRHLVTHP